MSSGVPCFYFWNGFFACKGPSSDYIDDNNNFPSWHDAWDESHVCYVHYLSACFRLTFPQWITTSQPQDSTATDGEGVECNKEIPRSCLAIIDSIASHQQDAPALFADHAFNLKGITHCPSLWADACETTRTSATAQCPWYLMSTGALLPEALAELSEDWSWSLVTCSGCHSLTHWEQVASATRSPGAQRTHM